MMNSLTIKNAIYLVTGVFLDFSLKIKCYNLGIDYCI